VLAGGAILRVEGQHFFQPGTGQIGLSAADVDSVAAFEGRDTAAAKVTTTTVRAAGYTPAS
jgi:hypothetical protein